ncbi:arginase family protein (plasmid) [Thioclava sp. 'Guangxiensis']|uniref:arginase family protein n=1 Tax=Thioclava sp. 'Guangxiensis' TaxID=3149044 RepID=UPI0032C42BB5
MPHSPTPAPQTSPAPKTLRLKMAQWQGGNLPAYHFGAELLAWLAPPSDTPMVEVPIDPPSADPLPLEDGILAKSRVLAQARSARALIDAHAPDRLVVFGGDCGVDLAPFAYLNEKYEGDLAILWVDSHPDIMTPAEFERAHAMVLGALMGQGDQDLADIAARKVEPAQVVYAGMDEMSPLERERLTDWGIPFIGPDQLAETSAPVLDWLRQSGKKHVAIHLDLDVLDPKGFRSLLFNKPGSDNAEWADTPQGRMSLAQVVRLLRDVAGEVEIVGLGIAEHLPWDVMNLRDMLAELPLLSD